MAILIVTAFLYVACFAYYELVLGRRLLRFPSTVMYMGDRCEEYVITACV